MNYVTGPDGHVMSLDEQQQARQRDAPVSTERRAPDTRTRHLATVKVERNKQMIRSYERRIKEDKAELETASEDWLKRSLREATKYNEQMLARLQTEIQEAEGSAAS